MKSRRTREHFLISMPLDIPFGHPDRESLVLSLDLPAKTDSGYEWINCRATVHAGKFQGTADLYLEARDLMSFGQPLESLYRTLKGEAALDTIESQISLKLVGDGKGHVELRGTLFDRCGNGNMLKFVLQYDQTLLWQTISALRDVLSQIDSKGKSVIDPGHQG
jgi:hypothetical protein